MNQGEKEAGSKEGRNSSADWKGHGFAFDVL